MNENKLDIILLFLFKLLPKLLHLSYYIAIQKKKLQPSNF